MKKFLLFLFSLLIGIGLLFWIIKVVGWEEIRLVLLTISGWQGIAILGLTVLMIFIGTWRWKEILKGQGYDIPLFSLFRPYLAGFSIVYLAPMIIFGGELFRGYLIKQRLSVSWEKAVASVILDKILESTICLLVIFIGFIFFFLKIGLPPKNLGMILMGFLIFFTAGIGFFYFKGFKKESIAKFFPKLFNQKLANDEPLGVEKEIFRFLKPRKGFFWRGMGLSLLKSAVTLARTWLLIFFLGKTVGLLPAISVLSFSYLVMMIPIPATIGSHEAVQAFAFGALGLGEAGIGAAFTMIIRAAELITALVGVFILFRLGIKLFEDNVLKKVEKLAINKD